MYRAGLVFLSALIGLLAVSPQAAEVPDLYDAEVPVSTQEPAGRETAFGLALHQVLAKVSGRRSVDSFPLLTGALRSPGRFVQQYQYRTHRSAGSDSTERESITLWTRFDANVVDELVREAGLPVWGRSRPATVVWASVETAGHRELLGTEDAGGYLASIEESARLRGIPLVFPLLDLQDRLAVKTAELWAGFLDGLRAASARYDVETVLLVRLRSLPPSRWEAHWSLLMDDGEQHWAAQDALPELLLEDGVHAVADLLAARYARRADQQATRAVDLVVTGVHTLEDYARALHYLGALDGVQRVDVDTVEPGQVRFRVEIRGGRSAIRQIVALGATLSPDGYADQDGALLMRLAQ